MRSLSSTVSEIPSSWLPSRRVVSKTSTASGSVRTSASGDMFQPVLVPVDLALDGREEGLLDLARDRTGLADLAVVDRADRDDLRGGAAEERLVAGVEVAAQDVGLGVVDAEVLGDRLD